MKYAMTLKQSFKTYFDPKRIDLKRDMWIAVLGGCAAFWLVVTVAFLSAVYGF